MRIATTLGPLCGAITVAASASASPDASSTTSWSATSVPLTTSSCDGMSWTSLRHPPASSVNATFSHATMTTAPTNLVNASTSHTAGVTGGAIPQQMQASMAGLLGFCIMGLVML